MPHVYLAGLFHETHTFLDERTELADFQIRRGDDLSLIEGDSSPLGGALKSFRSWNWELTLGPDYRALPGGIVADEVIEEFWQEVVSSWSARCEAIFLVLHGAMVTQTHLDVEGEILRRIRALDGASQLPIFGVYDLHANFSDAMASHADALFGYQCNPHTDARETSVRAANWLRHFFQSNQKPSIVTRSANLVWAPTNTGTADDPMKTLEAAARRIEGENEHIWAANVTPGFAFADTPDCGVSFQIVSTNLDHADHHLQELNELAHQLHASILPQEVSIAEAIDRLISQPISGLTVLVEPSDNIGGGAPGDTTGLLRALAESKNKIGAAAICIQDPDAANRLRRLSPGTRLQLPIGGRGSRFDEGPLDLEVQLVSASDGQFELEDKQSHLASMSGDQFAMGPCAVVRYGRLHILLTSRKTPPFDLGQWRSQGIEPSELEVIVVKAAVAHRQAYDPITARSLTVDSPGPCRSDLSQFQYQHARTGANSA